MSYYNRKKVDNTNHLMENRTEVALRYLKKGIALTPSQQELVRGIFEETDNQRHERALKMAIDAMKNQTAALSGCYYIEQFDYFYRTAKAQASNGNDINLSAPHPIPSAWLKMGEARKQMGNRTRDTKLRA